MTAEAVIPVLVQPSNFTADFTIKVVGLRVAAVNGVENIVKQVEWLLTGEEAGQKFELPQTTTLNDPSSESVVPLSALTEAAVVAWIEDNEDCLPSMKLHIQYVLDKAIAKASLSDTPMPWAPAPAANP